MPTTHHTTCSLSFALIFCQTKSIGLLLGATGERGGGASSLYAMVPDAIPRFVRRMYDYKVERSPYLYSPKSKARNHFDTSSEYAEA
jgi:hypothetical protein